MDETKIHTGTHIKLKRIDEDSVPQDFLGALREFAHGEARIQAIFLFALQQIDQDPQPSLVVSFKSRVFSSGNEDFLTVVDVIQLLLPEDLSLNLYRFESSDILARYCSTSVEPLYLRSASWLEKQKKKYPAT